MSAFRTCRRLSALVLFMSIAGAATAAAEPVCSIEVEGRPGKRFEPQEIRVSRACKDFTVVLRHVGRNSKEEAGHNWVLTGAGALEAVIADGLQAGPASDYLKPADPRILARTRMLGGGEQEAVRFSTAALAPGQAYAYFCSFPPHASMMRGTLTLVD